jgi:DNA-binding FadR family transcriptional regulator
MSTAYVNRLLQVRIVMALSITASTAANAKEEDAAAKIARPVQDLKKCKYCNYEHWDEFDLSFHEEMHEEYCEAKRSKRKNVGIKNDVHKRIQS